VPAVHNPHFRPFESPVPFIFVRSPVMRDWEFLLDSDDLMRAWAKRYGESGVLSLAAELRQLPWRLETHRSKEGAVTTTGVSALWPTHREGGRIARSSSVRTPDGDAGPMVAEASLSRRAPGGSSMER
jgi:hypothetical protein